MTRDQNGNDRRPGDGQAIRSREDFESALPLFVGGDLEASDERAVRDWLVGHPEDQELLVAAERARDVLKEHGRRVREMETPDLWPGVRAALEGAGARPSAGAAARAAARATARPTAAPAPTPGWGRGLAAAAALLVATGIGFLMSGPPAATEAPRATVAGSSGSEAPGGSEGPGGFKGPGAEVRLVASPRRGAPLRRPGPGEAHLIDEAPVEPLWLRVPQIPVTGVPVTGVPVTGIPVNGSAPAARPSGSQLVGDRR